MGLKKKLLSNIFIRNMLADFGGRSAYASVPGGFTPYFQYKVGVYEQDYYLYFPKEPFARRYINEIFNKLWEYNGYDIVRYLEFHYNAYNNKTDFLRFLQVELSGRMNFKISHSRHLKLQSALNWVEEKQQEYKKEQEEKLQTEIQSGVREIVQNHPAASATETDEQIRTLTQKLTAYTEEIMTATEKGIRDLTGSLTTGNIQLNNRKHEDKIMQLFIILQCVQAPPQVAKAEQLFKKFPTTDIAAILHLHFEAFKEKKLNTLQKNVGNMAEQIHFNQPAIEKLNKALQDFFY